MPPFTPDEAAACRRLIDLALAEDLGATGDRTSLATIPAEATARAAFVARRPGVVAGLPAAAMVCQAVDPALSFAVTIPDGSRVDRGVTLATVSGSLRSILAAERTALNFLQRLSGVATLTRKFVDAVAGTKAKMLDTRKTTPGWRLLEKFAVRCGGGVNHRVGLYDAILIKDNHLAGIGGDVWKAVELARAYPGNAGLPVEVEVDTLEQLEHALAVRTDIVLLDNMSPDQLRQAVARRDAVAPGVLLEASGGVNLDTIAAIAETGVDRISVGAVTHSAPALDIAPGLPVVTAPEPRETWHFDTAHVGRRVLAFDRLESTNTTAAELAGSEPDGLAVVAEFQTAGRGQFGRVWQARPGSSLLMSVALRPPPELCRPVILTALAALAVGDAVFALTGVQARIKWPNDLLVRGKKVCGILIENTGPTVIGVGLNLSQTPAEFVAADLPEATSLEIVAGQSFDVPTAAAAVIRQLDAEYQRLLNGERVAVEADWKWRVGLLGRPVSVELTDGTSVAGRLREMSFDGLELDTGDLVGRVIVPEAVRHVAPLSGWPGGG